MGNIMRMGDEPKYLGSWDLYEMPQKRIVVTIREIVEEMVEDTKGQKKKKAVCYFTENVKPMILNIENKKRLAKLFHTRDSATLVGKRIEIGYEQVKAFGDIHDALRIVQRLVRQDNTHIIAKCDECGSEIQPIGNMTGDQVAAYTKKKYGKALCSDCATKKAHEVTDNADE